MNIIFGIKELASDISGWISETPINRFDLTGSEGQAIWEPPLIGFADGEDSLFPFFKKDIGEFYWLPSEAFSLKYPDTSFEHLSVMSLAFAHTEKTRQDQRESVGEPSARWRYSRKHWPEFMREMADHITGYLAHLGVRSAVPELLPQWGWRQSGMCIQRCPAGAITPSGHDKKTCAAYIKGLNEKYAPEGEGDVECGLCQTGVPCENRRPVR